MHLRRSGKRYFSLRRPPPGTPRGAKGWSTSIFYFVHILFFYFFSLACRHHRRSAVLPGHVPRQQPPARRFRALPTQYDHHVTHAHIHSRLSDAPLPCDDDAVKTYSKQNGLLFYRDFRAPPLFIRDHGISNDAGVGATTATLEIQISPPEVRACACAHVVERSLLTTQ